MQKIGAVGEKRDPCADDRAIDQPDKRNEQRLGDRQTPHDQQKYAAANKRRQTGETHLYGERGTGRIKRGKQDAKGSTLSGARRGRFDETVAGKHLHDDTGNRQ